MLDQYNNFFRGAVEIISRTELETAFEQNRKLRVYLGIDPTSPYIHLGHTIPLRKLKILQDLGHKIILLIGDFTATIGDPSGHTTMRQPLTKEQVEENAKGYLDQARKILPLDNPDNPVEVRYNSEWHGRETKRDLLQHGFLITVQQLWERDLFQERVKNNLPISLSEFLYPYLQGYDAVQLEADLQLGGTDQTFNMLMGRDLRKKMANKTHSVLTTPLLLGTDGRKMSKSYGNTIGINDSPKEMFGKIMSIKDELIISYFTYLTDVTSEALEVIKQEIETGNPKNAKVHLAKLLVTQFYDSQKADEAEVEFNRIFVDRQAPEKMDERIIHGSKSIVELLRECNIASSNSEAQRLVDQGGVTFGDHKVTDLAFIVDVSGILQVGKRKFIQITKEES